ncbi:hypothetical protein SKAU_G00143490 [Synaphobranchus kaupii]|uniref:Uncharacterized protein n=1 Tax=Synaphobranchus kaupii TaxID=118154 RepID=A0A9Q1FSW5_SYNKA|nr:hypothetical protein SKAU_G00143490 [Synaphobranchus kaupii]
MQVVAMDTGVALVGTAEIRTGAGKGLQFALGVQTALGKGEIKVKHVRRKPRPRSIRDRRRHGRRQRRFQRRLRASRRSGAQVRRSGAKLLFSPMVTCQAVRSIECKQVVRRFIYATAQKVIIRTITDFLRNGTPWNQLVGRRGITADCSLRKIRYGPDVNDGSRSGIPLPRKKLADDCYCEQRSGAAPSVELDFKQQEDKLQPLMKKLCPTEETQFPPLPYSQEAFTSTPKRKSKTESKKHARWKLWFL